MIKNEITFVPVKTMPERDRFENTVLKTYTIPVKGDEIVMRSKEGGLQTYQVVKRKLSLVTGTWYIMLDNGVFEAKF